jgi:response regulator RpfG family c-di-GMP phosphodiesterase
MEHASTASFRKGFRNEQHLPQPTGTCVRRARRPTVLIVNDAVDFLFKPIDERVLRGKVEVLVTLEERRQGLRLALDLAETARIEAESVHDRIIRLQRVTASLNQVLTREGNGSVCLPLIRVIADLRNSLTLNELFTGISGHGLPRTLLLDISSEALADVATASRICLTAFLGGRTNGRPWPNTR